MAIRNATYHDAPAIKSLLQQLGYTSSNSLLVDQLETKFGNGDHQVIVYELKKEVVGFISVHYLPELGFDGGIAVITYLAIEETIKDHGIEKALDDFITQQARTRKCERIQVHCMDWRVADHQFYKQQGYQEYPKYYTKRLVYAE
jgi:N-acetylglutamate synthase-like GNAT family acetyltransferase